MILSRNFTLDELTISQEAIRSGLPNKPNAQQIASLKALCVKILQPLRDKTGLPIVVSSGFRSVTINRRIGGNSKSQHCRGEAADFTIPGMSVMEVVRLVMEMKLPIDQCIAEFGAWVHVSYSAKRRNQYLIATREGGKVFYKPF
jgi:uncharacterized protein YcbK (DUF882 family)